MPDETLATVIAQLGADSSLLNRQLDAAVARATDSAAQIEKIGLKFSPPKDFFSDFTKLPRELKETSETGFSLAGSTKDLDKVRSTFGKTGESVDQMSTKFRVGERTAKQLASGLIGNLNPALGGVISQVAGVGLSLRGLSPAFGIVAAGAVLFTTAMAAMIGRLNEVRETQFQTNRALAQGNFGALEGQVAKASDELARFDDQLKDISGGGIAGFVTRFQTILQSTEQFDAALATSRAALQQVFVQFERPIKESKLAIAAAELRKQFNDLAIQQATTIPQVNSLFDKQADEVIKITEEQKKLLIKEAERDLKVLLASQDVLRFGERKRVLQAELNQLDEQNTLGLAKNNEARRQIIRSLDEVAAKTRQFADERAGFGIDEQKNLLSNLVAERKQRADSALDALKIDREAAQGQQDLDRERFDQRKAALDREVEATRQSTGLNAEERRSKEEQLNQQLAALASQRVISEQNFNSQTQQNEFSLFRQRQADEDALFQQRRALGQATVQEVIARDQAIAASANRTRDERLAAERRVFEETKRMRDEASSVGKTLAQEAIESLRSQGVTQTTKFGLENEIQRIQTERAQLVSEVSTAFNTGVAIDLNRITAAQDARDKIQFFGEAVEKFGSIGNILSTGLQTSATAFINALGGISAEVDKTFTTIEGRINAGSAAIVTLLQDRIVGNLAKQLAAEAKRF